MLAKLVKFVILTRFSKPLLGLVTFFLVYDVVIRAVTTGNSPEFSGGFSYYAVGASIRRFGHHHPLPLRILSCRRWNSPNHDIARGRPSDPGCCSHCAWRRFEHSLDPS